MSKGRSTGLIFPKNFEVTPTLQNGIKMTGVGWYFPINDHLDLQVLADLSSRGNWGIRTITNYNVKYKYRGQVNLSYSRNYTEDNYGIKQSVPAFALKINHSQDAKAHPYRKISGSINISTSGYYQKDRNDARTQLKNTYTSNFGLSYTVPNSPISLSLDMRHEQNTCLLYTSPSPRD